MIVRHAQRSTPGPPAQRAGLIRPARGLGADGREEPVPSTIEDPAVLDALRPVLS